MKKSISTLAFVCAVAMATAASAGPAGSITSDGGYRNSGICMRVWVRNSDPSRPAGAGGAGDAEGGVEDGGPGDSATNSGDTGEPGDDTAASVPGADPQRRRSGGRGGRWVLRCDDLSRPRGFGADLRSRRNVDLDARNPHLRNNDATGADPETSRHP